jgi:hypothetical protein
MGLVEKYEIVIFVALAYLFSWIFWAPLEFFGIGQGSMGSALYDIGALGPLVAAVEMILLLHGREGLNKLLKGIVRWRIGAEWYIVALFLPLAIEFAVLFTVALSGVDLPISRHLVADGPTFIGQAYYSLVTTVAIFGFLVPRLLKNNSPLVVSILATAFAIAWRAPFVLAYINGGRADYEMWWALGNLGAFFIFTWLYRNVKASLLLLTLFDLGLNYFRWFSRGVMNASLAGDVWGLDFSLHLFMGIIILLAYWKYFLGIENEPSGTPEVAIDG